MKKFFAILMVSAVFVFADNVVEIGSADAPAVSSQKRAKTDISYFDALVLGLVEGITEYLPISSTGHLIISNAFLSLDSQTPLVDKTGAPILTRNGEPFTMKAAADAYAIVIQIGAIAAVALLYWDYILRMLMGVLGRNPTGLKLLRNLILAFLPAAVVGLLLHGAIETYLFGVKPVIIALAAGAALMFFVQKRYDARANARARFMSMEDLSARSSLYIGILQCVSMWPGTSRSMMTILGGYLAGMRPADAARFSFLLGLMTLSAASVFKMYKEGDMILATLSAGPLATGLLVAFVSAALSIKWLVGFLTRRGLSPFAWYRIAIAAVLSAMIYFDLIA